MTHRKTVERSASGGFHDRRGDDLLMRIVDGGLAGCIFVVPRLLGGRHPLGQLVLVALAVTVALAWVIRQYVRGEGTWRHSAAEPVLLAGMVLLLLQLIPLSPKLLTHLTPHTAQILPLWAEKGTRFNLPQRPGGCFAQIKPGPFFGSAEGDSAVRLGTWSTVSLTPVATREALVMFLSYGLLFLVTVQRIRVVEDVERLLRWCALSAVAIAGFALVQLLGANGKFFWFYEHPFSTTYRTAKGCFTNRNHFAHFLALGIGPLIWWLQHSLGGQSGQKQSGQEQSGQGQSGQGQSDWRSGDFNSKAARFGSDGPGVGVRGLALGVVLFAVLLSLSRGGAVVTFLAAAICGAVCYRASALGIRFLAGLAAVGVMIGVSLAIFGYEPVTDRLDDLTTGSIESLDGSAGRRSIWAAVLKAVPDFPALGSGVGSHREVYPMYFEASGPTEYTHAESGYLQVGLETGAAGLTLLAAGMIVCFLWCVVGLRAAVSRRLLVCMGAVSASLAVSAVHSLFDFIWYVPACMAMVAILAGCACRLCQLAQEGTNRHTTRVAMPRHLVLAQVLLLAAIGSWMVVSRIGPVPASPYWDRYRIAALASQEPRPIEAHQQQAADWEQVNASKQAAARRTICELEEVVRWNASHARARLRLAAAYLRLFDLIQESPAAKNAMALAQIRDAAVQSRFRFRDEARRQQVSPREVLNRWLSEAIGEHCRYLELALRHTRHALALCPLQGEGYLYLAELSFLETARPSATEVYIDQALRVRPFDGAVLFAAGKEAWLAGDYRQGIDYWQRSFRSGPTHQKQIIELLAGSFPHEVRATEVPFILETFQPDMTGLMMLEHRYRLLAQSEPKKGPGLICRNGPEGASHKLNLVPFSAQLRQLQQHYAKVAESRASMLQGEEAGRIWLLLQRVYRDLGQGERASVCGKNALKFDPNNHLVRHRLVKNLIDNGQYAEAEQHLRWLLGRKPGNESLQNKLRNVVRQRIGTIKPRPVVAPKAQPGSQAPAWEPTAQKLRLAVGEAELRGNAVQSWSLGPSHNLRQRR